jgi:hypothetical protein
MVATARGYLTFITHQINRVKARTLQTPLIKLAQLQALQTHCLPVKSARLTRFQVLSAKDLICTA